MNKKNKNFLYFIPLFSVLGYYFINGSLDITPTLLFLASILFTIFMVSRTFNRRRTSDLIQYEAPPTLFVNIIENLADPFLLIDEKKKVKIANKSAENVFGDDLSNNNISNYLSDAEVLSAIDQVIATGNSDTIEFITPAPWSRSLLLRIHALEENYDTDEDEENSKTILLTLYDITSISEAERMRVDFVANVSHELRTPLASILGFIETLQGPAKNNQTAADRFLQIMQDEASRMTRLIEDLLSLSHIEREAHIPPEERISLDNIIGNVKETLNLRCAKKNMEIIINNDEEYDDIIGDRDQLTQVFQNLIDNAIKYGDENTNIDIRVQRTNSEYSEGEFVQIDITNMGSGIAPEHIERLTERFYRVDTARSRSLGGTGLGLAIVKHIVQRHNGQLSFQSEVGKSTTASIFLPLLDN
ncbi:MAG: ATP-binding protein [Emcibacteraceae bacterium]|nr:ATP-binding protein [Emcibacteraceae bacterium]